MNRKDYAKLNILNDKVNRHVLENFKGERDHFMTVNCCENGKLDTESDKEIV